MIFTLKEWRRGFRSFTSTANETLAPPIPSEGGKTSKTIMSNGLVSKGSFSRARNPGFKTAQTCTAYRSITTIRCDENYSHTPLFLLNTSNTTWLPN